MQIGDDIRNADGSTGEVESVAFEQTSQEMYNLTVDEAHTFYVGDGQWLVHNLKICDPRELPSVVRHYTSKNGYKGIIHEGEIGPNFMKLSHPEWHFTNRGGIFFTNTDMPRLNLDFKDWTLEEQYRRLILAEVGIPGDLFRPLESGYARTEYFVDVAPILLPGDWAIRKMNRLEYIFLSESKVDITKAIVDNGPTSRLLEQFLRTLK